MGLLEATINSSNDIGDGIKVLNGLEGDETVDGFKFVAKLYSLVKDDLESLRIQRIKDRKFIDQRIRATSLLNEKFNYHIDDIGYTSILGQKDENGRVVIGPNTNEEGVAYDYLNSNGKLIAPLPNFLKGYHVTLFGLSNTKKSCEDAKNCFFKKLDDEPNIVSSLIETKGQVPPRWGVDSEDSQTPLRMGMVESNLNLNQYYSTTTNDKNNMAAQAFKRLPGLALDSTFCFYDGQAIPLHIYDFGLHLFKHYLNPEALVFYIPKIENEEEALYISKLISLSEKLIQSQFGINSYQKGTVRVLVVLENARAIFRANEIADALYPYFCGASLGWHDFLASTARLYKESSSYRIPSKSDSSIVIKHVKASHELVARVIGGRGGLAIGGMYGILPTDKNKSFQVVMEGFFKDVFTQLKRGLKGIWVPHSDFVRPGLALFEAWKLFEETKDKNAIIELINGYIVDKKKVSSLVNFVFGPDAGAFKKQTPEALIVADLGKSINLNNSIDNIRYNTFQSLQYLADWLAGNGCVSLPGKIQNEHVRILDDLATVERSRWEVWHEVKHGRLSLDELVKISHIELNFIRRDLGSIENKFVEVKYDQRTAKWYPIALEIWLKLTTETATIIEFVTELLLPFTSELLRYAEDPLRELLSIEPDNPLGKLPSYVKRFHYFYERCGCTNFAKAMSKNTVINIQEMYSMIMKFSKDEIIEAAALHGDIGQNTKSLDRMASTEQAAVGDDALINNQLIQLGKEYYKKFHGIKFLVSAKGKNGKEMLSILNNRLKNSMEEELINARTALYEITLKRISQDPLDDNLMDKIKNILKKHNVSGASICIQRKAEYKQNIALGNIWEDQPTDEHSFFEIASLSKTIGSCFAIEYFSKKGISLEAKVNDLFKQCDSAFRLKSSNSTINGDDVRLRDLMSHCALNMHYVNGIPLDEEMLLPNEFLHGNEKYDYPPVDVINTPGKIFKYSGAGFLVLEHLIESFENRHGKFAEIIQPFLNSLGVSKMITFEHKPNPNMGFQVAHGYDDNGKKIKGTRLMFPSIAAGALGTPNGMMQVLDKIAKAYQNVDGEGPISHNTACSMLLGTDKGCLDFMGCQMGVGVFVGEAGPNRFTIHQGANDGFRSVFLHCFDGPDMGTGIVCFANGDNRAMFSIAEILQQLLIELKLEGIDISNYQKHSLLNTDNIPQEQIVNLGYKNLVFSAFQETLPDGIIKKGPIDPMANINKIVGAKIIKVSSQRFARVENLASDHLPIFDPALFCPMGKVMDSWETARHNPIGFDEAIFELHPSKIKSKISNIAISTKYHFGNQAESICIYATKKGKTDEKEMEWIEIIPRVKLEGHSDKFIHLPIHLQNTYDRIKIHIFPDGGLSRIGLFDDNIPIEFKNKFLPANESPNLFSPDPIPQTKKPLQLLYLPTPELIEFNKRNLVPGQMFDAASLAYGSELVSVTNQHYGPAGQVFSPYIPLSMHDGFESARSREPGHIEELVVQLGIPSEIIKVELDFKYFVNNNPRDVSIFAKKKNSNIWEEIVPITQVKAFQGNTKVFEINSNNFIVDQLKLNVYPDGGVNRFRAFARYTGSSNL